MFISGHPALLNFLIIYSVLFLLNCKTRNEFILIFTIFMFFIERNSWENGIVSLTEVPIRILPSDIALVILTFFIFFIFLRGDKPIFFDSVFFFIFSMFIFLSAIIGIFRFSYASIAEFRTVFYFLIIMLFISSNVDTCEVLPLIKSISSYLISLILLAPINLQLTNNFEISVANRQYGALMYESIVLGFVGGLFYYRFIDTKFKLPLYLLPVLFLMIPFTSHRSAWGAIALMLPFIFYWYNSKKILLFIIILVSIIFSFINIDTSFFQERLTVFTSIQTDNTGSWRLLIWNAVIEDATFWGKGLGARFIVSADKIGYDAMAGAHNGYITILYYLGYLGLSFIAVLFLFFLYKTGMYSSEKFNYANNIVVHRIGFLSTLSLIAFMTAYHFDIIGIIFIAFSLKASCRKQEKVVYSY